MPKQKTHKGTAKRVRLTGTGKLVREHTNNQHKFEHKSSSRKRRIKGIGVLSPSDTRSANGPAATQTTQAAPNPTAVTVTRARRMSCRADASSTAGTQYCSPASRPSEHKPWAMAKTDSGMKASLT